MESIRRRTFIPHLMDISHHGDYQTMEIKVILDNELQAEKSTEKDEITSQV